MHIPHLPHNTHVSYDPQAPYQAAPATPHPTTTDGTKPLPVVRVLSPLGVEYAFMSICLLVGATALVATLLAIIHSTYFPFLAYTISALLVTVPVFSALFLRLKKLEAHNPQLRFDPSKRRSTQKVQFVTFIVCLFTFIGWISTIFASMSGAEVGSLGAATLDALCILVIAGGILAYYWHDEHQKGRHI